MINIRIIKFIKNKLIPKKKELFQCEIYDYKRDLIVIELFSSYNLKEAHLKYLKEILINNSEFLQWEIDVKKGLSVGGNPKKYYIIKKF